MVDESEVQKAPGGAPCAKCGWVNEPGTLYCGHCGSWLSSWRPIQASEPEPPPSTVSPPLLTAVAPARLNSLAMAGLVCSIIGFFLFGVVLGPLGIVLGVIALIQIKASGGNQGGKGLAVAAIVVGTLSFLGALAVILFYLPDQLSGFFG